MFTLVELLPLEIDKLLGQKTTNTLLRSGFDCSIALNPHEVWGQRECVPVARIDAS